MLPDSQIRISALETSRCVQRPALRPRGRNVKEAVEAVEAHIRDLPSLPGALPPLTFEFRVVVLFTTSCVTDAPQVGTGQEGSVWPGTCPAESHRSVT